MPGGARGPDVHLRTFPEASRVPGDPLGSGKLGQGVCVCIYVYACVCVRCVCVVLVCMWMRLMDCLCVDSAAFMLVYVASRFFVYFRAFVLLYALRVFPAVTRLTVYRRLRVR